MFISREPDSIVEGISVYSVRKAIGAELARENGVDVDYVIPVPDSGTPAAIGYAEARQDPVRAPASSVRIMSVVPSSSQATASAIWAVKLKHNANKNLVAGKKIVLIGRFDRARHDFLENRANDARGRRRRSAYAHRQSTDDEQLLLRRRHTRTFPKLLASRMDVEEMRAFIQADSLAFLSIDGLYRALGEDQRNNGKPQYCDACFTGDYPDQPDRP